MMRNKFILLFVAAIIGRIIFAFIYMHPDVWVNMDWGTRFFEYGAGGFFAPEANVWNYTWPNQPPGNILIFAAMRKIFEFLFSLFWLINIKIPAFPSGIVSYFELYLYPAITQLPGILGDFGIAYLIYKILLRLKDKKAATFSAIIFLLNPIIWYNSSVWGQTDSVVNFFGLLAFYLAFRNKYTLSIAAFALSLYIKISLAIFLPIYLILLYKKTCVRDIIKFSIPTVFWIGAITLMFSNGSEPFNWLYNLYTQKILVNQLQVITANAFNFWAILTGILEQPHTLPFLGLTYQYWSYILLAVLITPILRIVWKKHDEKTIYTMLALTAFTVWMFSTNMHERYLYPLFPYFTIIAVLNRKLLPIYWVVSGISLLNLYNFWFTPRIEPIVQALLFQNRLLPRILGIVNLGLFVKIYKKHINLL